MHSAMLLVATLKAIGTAFVMAAAGVLATKKGLITNPGRRCLAELSMNIFMPSLLFSSVVSCSQGHACDPVSELIKESWYLFLFPVVVVGSGILLGNLVAVATGAPSSFKRACIGSVAFANSTGMSITLLGILGPILLHAGVVDVDPLKYQPVYLILYPILQWSVGSYLFGLSGRRQAQSQERQPEGAIQPMAVPDNFAKEAGMGSHTLPPVPPAKTLTSLGSGITRRTSTITDAVRARTLTFLEPADVDLAHEPDMAPLDLPVGSAKSDAPGGFSGPVRGDAEQGGVERIDTDGCSEATSETRDSSEVSTGPMHEGAASLLARGATVLKCAAKGVWSVVQHAVVPPVVGAVLGVVVAAIVPLRRLLVDVDATGASPPLELVFLALNSIGRASVPVNMLVLGSNLAQGANLRAIPRTTTVGVILMKQVGQPVMIGVVIYLLARMVHGSTSIFLVMIIMSCTPTANNLMVMVELSGQNKEAMTACIFAQYLAAPFVMTLVITCFLLLLESSWYLP